jgi:hypothetical protein
MKSYHLMPDYESFSSLILDEIFKNKSLLSWDELDAAICRHNLDKVSMMEPANVFRNSATEVPLFILSQLQEPARGTWLWAKGLFRNFVEFFWDDNGYLFWSFVYLSALAIRFALVFNDYSPKSGVWVGIARGCGADLNILLMTLPLTMMKSTHTRLRTHPLTPTLIYQPFIHIVLMRSTGTIQRVLKYFPIDDMIEIHINLSKLAVAFTVVHVS